jgi:hypothetical protein
MFFVQLLTTDNGSRLTAHHSLPTFRGQVFIFVSLEWFRTTANYIGGNMSFITKAKDFVSSQKTTTDKLKAKASRAYQYAKENPDDVMLAGLLLCGINQQSTLNEIENASEVSAYVDVHEFMGS